MFSNCLFCSCFVLISIPASPFCVQGHLILGLQVVWCVDHCELLAFISLSRTGALVPCYSKGLFHLQATCCLQWFDLFQRLMLPRGRFAEPTVLQVANFPSLSHLALHYFHWSLPFRAPPLCQLFQCLFASFSVWSRPTSSVISLSGFLLVSHFLPASCPLLPFTE